MPSFAASCAVLITKTDGKSISGVLKSEDAKEVRVLTDDGQLVSIPKDDIDERPDSSAVGSFEVVSGVFRLHVDFRLALPTLCR